MRKLFALSAIPLLALLTSCSAVNTYAVALIKSASVKVCGAGRSYEPLKYLVEAYNSDQSDQSDQVAFHRVDYGLRGVKRANCDVGGVNHNSFSESQLSGLQYVGIAELPVIFITNKDVTGVDNITAEEIRNIHAGVIKKWSELGGPEQDINLFIEDGYRYSGEVHYYSEEVNILRENYLGKMSITRTAQGYASNSVIADTPYSISVSVLDDEIAELDLNVLNIDGISPNEGMVSGEYLMRQQFGVVVKQTPSESVQAFIDFASSPEGKSALEAGGYFAVKSP